MEVSSAQKLFSYQTADCDIAFQKLCLEDSEKPLTQELSQLFAQTTHTFQLPPFENPRVLAKNTPQPKATLKLANSTNPVPKANPQIQWNPLRSTRGKRKHSENSCFTSAMDLYSQSKKAKPNEPKPEPSKSEGPSLGLRKPFVCPKPQGHQEEEKVKGVEDKLVEMIESEIITHNPGVCWEDIAGLEFAKKGVYEAIVWPLKRPDLFRGLRAPPKGLLLFGPPGTGKTMIGKAIASAADATFFSISASSITSKWIGEGEKLVKTLFALAVKHQPSVIFLDEIDSLLSMRNESEHEGSRRVKTEFLVQIDGAATNPDDRILMIGATNRPQELDEAVRRRLAKRMYIPLPNLKGRKQLFKTLLNSVTNSLTEEDLGYLASTSKGYSGSDLKNLCSEASLNPLRREEDITKIDANSIPPLTLEDFQDAFKVVKPSVSYQDTEELLKWNQNYGSFQFNFEEINT